jgi:hypothetical protein
MEKKPRGRPKGYPKSGGRKAGVPDRNKKPQMAPLRIQLRDLGFNLGEEMVKFYNSVEDPQIKFKLVELMSKYTNVAPVVEDYIDPDKVEDDESEDDDTESLLLAVQ